MIGCVWVVEERIERETGGEWCGEDARKLEVEI